MNFSDDENLSDDYYSPDEGDDYEIENNDDVREFDLENYDDSGYLEEENENLDEPSAENDIFDKDKATLLNWFIESKIPRANANKLLQILPTINQSTYPMLPKDVRSLLPKKQKIEVKEKNGEQYAYFGIANSLRSVPGKFFDANVKKIELSINIDGLPLFKSSCKEFWPILGAVGIHDVFIIALIYCKSKPDDFNDFLKEFVKKQNFYV